MFARAIVLAAISLLTSLIAVRPAAAQAVDEAFRSDIEKLLEVTGATKTATAMANVASNSFFDALKRKEPDVPDRALEIIKQVLDEEFRNGFEGPAGMKAELVKIYARHFSHDEIRGLLAFYATDLGKKTLSALPALMQEGAAIGQTWAKENMSRIQSVLLERLKAEGFLQKH